MRNEHTDDGCDELVILARDSRASRKRTSYWTTGLIASGMAASTVYVGTVNQQLDQLSATNSSTAAQNIVLRNELRAAEGERAALLVQRNVYKNFVDQYPMLKLAEELPDVIQVGPGAPDRLPPQTAYSNVVWVLDGSRRVPMTDGDILWIPEGHIWIEKESEPGGGNFLRLYEDNPAITGSVGRRLKSIPGQWEEFREGSDCMEITLHSNSNRPGFKGGDYVDVEVLWTKDDNCSPTRP